MVLGWRRAFCTSIPKNQERDSPIIKEKPENNPSPTLGSRFGGFFSNPSTPRMHSQPVFTPTLRCRTTVDAPPPRQAAAVQTSSAPQSPKLRCKTRIGPPKFFTRSTPSSPRSPTTFSLLKSSLRLSKNRCEICLEGLKTGQGTAIFTAECRHSFHFPCIAAQVRKQCSLTCPICKSIWKEIHLSPPPPAAAPTQNHAPAQDFEQKRDVKKPILKVYNDDEPLSSPTSGARFNPIPESDEYEDRNDEFPGFFAANNVVLKEVEVRNVEFGLLSETAVLSVGKSSETHAVVLKIRAPAACAKRRAPIDLVAVVNVGRSMNSEKIQLMKKGMRTAVSSLTAADRFSIVAFSSTSKRLLPLRRMTTAGKKAARRIIDAIIPLDDSAASAMDSLKKATKVIEDRREKNPAAAIMLFSDGHRGGSAVSHTLFAEIPLHSVNLSVTTSEYELPDEILAKCITNSLSVVIQDLKFMLGFTMDSAPSEVSAVYSSYGGRPTLLGSGPSWCRMGDLCSDEEREVLIELKVQSLFAGVASMAHRRLSVRCQYKDPSTQELIHDKEGAILVPFPRAIGSSSTRESQRLRCLFVTTRALAESRRMADRHDIVGAYHMLASARALILQSGSGSGEEFVRGLEAELAELSLRRQDQRRHNQNQEREAANAKAEPLTPTSAWRAAERLAKLAIMKKSLNRVSDLHGFENARF